MSAPDNAWMHTEMGSTTPTTITVCGLDLADDIMGKISFPDLAFRMVAGRLPDERESVLFNAVLVSLADHGITPTVLAARLTYLGAPEALQGAVAAGLLGGGSVFLGVAEDAARFLHETLADLPSAPDDDAMRAAASVAIARLARRRASHPRARPSRAQGDRSARPADVRARDRARPARAPSPAPADRRRGVGRAARPSPPDQRCRRRRVPRSPTSDSTGGSSAGSRCWPGPRACSATSPRRCARRWRRPSGRPSRPDPPTDVIRWQQRSQRDDGSTP